MKKDTVIRKCGSYKNVHGKKLCLINRSKRIKSYHLNKDQIHLSQKGSKVLGDAFFKKKYQILLIDIILMKTTV